MVCLVVADGLTLINTPSSGAETSRLLTVKLLKVCTSQSADLRIVYCNSWCV